MATSVGTAFVDIQANTTNFEKQLETSVNGALKGAGNAAQQFGRTSDQALMGLSKNLTSVGKDLTKKVTLPLVAVGTGALITAGNFEAGMNKVRAITGATEVEVKQLSDQAKELGSSTKFSASEAANAMSFLGMAGFDTNQIMGAMPGTLELAAAANMGLAEAADITSNVLSGFGIEVDQLGSVNDALVKTLTRTNTDLSQLGQAFKFVGPVAKGAGISFNETAAAIGLLGNAGIQAGMAGTSLRGAITALLNPSAQVSGIMQSLGLNVKDANGELLPLNEIIEQLEVSGASTADMMQIFGQRAGPAMMALVEQGSEALRGLTTELDESGGTAQRIAEIQMEGFNGAMTSLKSAVEGLMIAIGESGLLQAMTKFAGFLTNLARVASSLPGPLMAIGVAIGAMAAAAGPLLIISGSLIRNFVTMRKTVNALRNSKIAATIAAHGLRTAMMGIPLLAVAAGALAIFSAFKKSAASAKEFRDAVLQVSNQVKEGEAPLDVARNTLTDLIDKHEGLRGALLASSFTFEQFADAAVNDTERFMAMQEELMTLLAVDLPQHSSVYTRSAINAHREMTEEITGELNVLMGGLSEAAIRADEWEAINSKAALNAGNAFDALGDLSTEALLKIMDQMEQSALVSEDAMSAMGSAAELASRIIKDELKRIEQAAEDLALSVDKNASAAADSFLKLSEDGKKNIDQFITDMIVGAARLQVFQDNIIAIAAATDGNFANHLLSMGESGEELIAKLADPRNARELEESFRAYALQAEVGSRNMSDEFAKVDPAFKKTLEGVAGLTETEMENIRKVAETKAVEVGVALMLGQVEGITKNSPAVEDAVRLAVNNAINAALDEAGIRSPSRRMADEVGRPMSEGVAVGIEEGSEEIDAAMRRTVQKALVEAATELSKRIDSIADRAGGSFMKLSDDGQSSVEAFISETVHSSKRLKGFQDNILNITELTSGEFGLYLLEMGEDAEELVRDLADPNKVHALDQAYAAWRDSTEIAARNMSEEFAKVDPAFAEILENLTLTIEEEMKPVIEEATKSGRSAGSSLINGMIAGMRAENAALQAQIDENRRIVSGQTTAAVAPSVGRGFAALDQINDENLRAIAASRGQGNFGGPLVNIQNATFSDGTDAQAVAQQVAASLASMVPS